MFDFTLSLQPVIQFMTLPPPPGFEELVSTFANEVRNAFERTATRIRAIVHSVQFQTSGNLSDDSHIQSPPLASTKPILGPVEARRNRCPLSATTSARLVARVTARVVNYFVQRHRIVVSNPKITRPRESPTSNRSIPARSSTLAIVASYAVNITIRSPRSFISARSGTRTFLDAVFNGLSLTLVPPSGSD